MFQPSSWWWRGIRILSGGVDPWSIFNLQYLVDTFSTLPAVFHRRGCFKVFHSQEQPFQREGTMTFDPLESGPRALRPVQHPSQVKSDFSEKTSSVWCGSAERPMHTGHFWFFQRFSGTWKIIYVKIFPSHDAIYFMYIDYVYLCNDMGWKIWFEMISLPLKTASFFIKPLRFPCHRPAHMWRHGCSLHGICCLSFFCEWWANFGRLRAVVITWQLADPSTTNDWQLYPPWN